MSAKTAAVIVTACGKRKSLVPSAALRAAALQPGDVASVARKWVDQVSREPVRIRASELYQGRAFREAEIAAAPLAAKMYVISAGLGLVPVEVQVPSYALSVATGVDNVLVKIAPTEAPSDWWRELTKISGSHSFKELMATSGGPVLIAAGSVYLAMIGRDLEALDPVERSRVRLFTAASLIAIPASLQSLVMPYDRRLEALPGRAGTVSDFAQRALRHFSETILPVAPNAAADAHSAYVLASLAGVDAPARRRGASMSDGEIIALIRANWEEVEGKSAAMLRLLRDSFRVACEQKRFKKLFEDARLERIL